MSEEPDDLNAVRLKARERMKGVCTVNRVCDGAPGRACMGQRYGSPIGLGGTGKGLAFTANVEALDRVKLKTRLIGGHFEPDLSAEVFKRTLSLPVMASSLSGVKASMGGAVSEMEFAVSVLRGSIDAGTVGLTGNTADDGQETTGVDALERVGAGIPIFKPQSNPRLRELIGMAEKAGALAVGVDLDGVGSTNWERAGKPVFRKSVPELRELVDSTGLPFLAKGIMSVEDALDALDAGVAAIDVSNHGGRALDSTRGVADVLPEVAAALGGKVTVTAGGGVRTGFDVLKLLALGSDAVLLGRDIARAAIGGGAPGVAMHLEYVRSDLKRAMLLTGCPDIASVSAALLDKGV